MRTAKIYAHIQGNKYDESGKKNAGRRANYILRGEENKKKGSIRRDSFWFAKGLGAKSYHRTPGEVVKAFEYMEQNWIKSKNSKQNKRKKLVKFGAVDSRAEIVSHSGVISLPFEITIEEMRILARRIMSLVPDDCPFVITAHFGKTGEHKHLHFEYSERHNFGYGERDKDVFGTVIDEKGKRCIFIDMLNDTLREFYTEYGFSIDEPGTKESLQNHIDRAYRNGNVLEAAKLERKYIERIKQEEIDKFDEVCERIEDSISAEERFNRAVDEMKMFDIRQVDDSIDKEEKSYIKVDDSIVEIDGSDLELMKKDGREMILKKKSLIDSRRREEDDEINKENFIHEQKNIEIQNQASLGNEFFGINNQRNTSRFRRLAKRVDPNSKQYKCTQAILNKRKLKSSEDRTKDLRSAFEEAMNKADIKNKTTRSI